MSALAVEDPSHRGGRATLTAAGLELVPVPVDEEGLVVDRLDASGTRAVFVTPAHQFSTGVVMSAPRRAAMLTWAARRGAFIVEDDYDAEYRYDRLPVGALQGLGPARVIYAGSASKSLAPALRLGWIVAPPDLAPAFREQKALADLGSPTLEQLAYADFMAKGALDAHLRRCRLTYRRRRDALVGSLEEAIPDIGVTGIAAGLHLTAILPADVDDRVLVREAERRSIALDTLSEHRIAAVGPPGILIGYAATPEAGVRATVRELAALLAALRARPQL
jgi:GntR family transcriptional regulator/MocR family aminotransferase